MSVAVDLTKAVFAGQMHTVFTVRLPADGATELELVEMSESKLDPRYESFSLTFRGDRTCVLDQRTYPVRHPAIGAFDLFITPIARNNDGSFYEAVFNRLRSGS